ncbi:MAG: hypothetical protein LBB25_01940 [Holosporaceae bacterium]|jgi:hypothetical protein|nr:hypothetical protein [Holosporaceae bacterium]
MAIMPFLVGMVAAVHYKSLSISDDYATIENNVSDFLSQSRDYSPADRGKIISAVKRGRRIADEIESMLFSGAESTVFSSEDAYNEDEGYGNDDENDATSDDYASDEFGDESRDDEGYGNDDERKDSEEEASSDDNEDADDGKVSSKESAEPTNTDYDEAENIEEDSPEQDHANLEHQGNHILPANGSSRLPSKTARSSSPNTTVETADDNNLKKRSPTSGEATHSLPAAVPSFSVSDSRSSKANLSLPRKKTLLSHRTTKPTHSPPVSAPFSSAPDAIGPKAGSGNTKGKKLSAKGTTRSASLSPAPVLSPSVPDAIAPKVNQGHSKGKPLSPSRIITSAHPNPSKALNSTISNTNTITAATSAPPVSTRSSIDGTSPKPPAPANDIWLTAADF